MDEKEAEVVRQIFRLARPRNGGIVSETKRIAEALNASGIKHRGMKWTIRLVEQVLENPVCIGKRITFRTDPRTHRALPEEKWVTTDVAPILEQAEFETAQKLLAMRGTIKTTN
ncbi:recombinase family protein [Paraburkholderia phenazinium]|uniref:recombinase family protein n=1 Tax=Paraburkholderia phenazinium TaxID=60549 RepID=UPI00158D4FFA|nr:recombinase family protein [Paraburkholderia phenazinium]